MTIFIRPEQVDALTTQYTKRSYFLGLDLGQSVDYTAYSVLEQVSVPFFEPGPKPESLDELNYDTTYHITHLDRLPLRTAYPDVVAHVQKLLITAPLTGNSRLVCDMSGVGRPVYDLFVKAKLKPVGINITAGEKWTRDGDVYHVAKRLLISTLDAAMNDKKIFAAPALTYAEVLRSELADLHRKFTDSGYQQVEARSGRHDDMVLSVAVALWYAMQPPRKMTVGRFVI